MRIGAFIMFILAGLMAGLVLALLISASVEAQITTIDGREVELDTTKVSHRAVRDSLLVWRAARVDSASNLLKAKIEADSTNAAVLDSTGITIQADRLDEAYVRLAIPQTERLLVAARAQWLLDGALPAEGDTIRATKRVAISGLARLAAFWR